MASQIDWLNGGDGLPLTSGCTKIAQGCENCWACRLAATRLKHHPRYAGLAFQAKHSEIHRTAGGFSVTEPGYRWTGEVRLHPKLLDMPLHWRKPRRVFVCPMSDLFHEDVPDEFIDQVFARMALCPWHTFILLTKRAQRMQKYLTESTDADGQHTRLRVGLEAFGVTVEQYGKSGDIGKGIMLEREGELVNWPLPNVWLGISVSTQAELDKNIRYLLDTPATVRVLSIEPCLEGMNLHIGDSQSDRLWRRLHGGSYQREFIHWVICGCESGPNRRPFELDWARDVRDQCAAAGVAYYYKQGRNLEGKLIHKPFLDGIQHLDFPGGIEHGF